MKNIKYKFVDGTTKNIEVEDKFYEEYQKLEIETKRLERKETRRHISINVFDEQGIEFEDETYNLEDLLFSKYLKQKIKFAINTLTRKQQDLVRMIFYEGMRASDIAKKLGVNKSVISKQLKRIYTRLKNNLKNFY